MIMDREATKNVRIAAVDTSTQFLIILNLSGKLKKYDANVTSYTMNRMTPSWFLDFKLAIVSWLTVNP